MNRIHLIGRWNSIPKPQRRNLSTFDNIIRPEVGVEKIWFQENHDITNKMKKQVEEGGIHFIFLEGPHGSAKREILNRLNKLKYTTYNPSFINICKVRYRPKIDLY